MKKKILSYRDLDVWKKGHRLVRNIYELSKGFPKEELWGITGQLRRAAVSISCNIVEGHSRTSRKDYIHFLNISQGSLEEVRYLLLLSRDLNYLPPDTFEALEKLSTDISKMLRALIRSLKSKE